MRLRDQLRKKDNIDPDDVILDPATARGPRPDQHRHLPRGNLAPAGLGHQEHLHRPGVVDADGIYRKTGPARVFTTERRPSPPSRRGDIRAGDVIVLICRGPMGAGMEEIYQVTSALKHLEFGKHVAVITDARFSGVSTGACIGHVGPEALAGGPVGRVLDDDLIRITVDRNRLEGTIDLVGHGQQSFDPAWGERELAPAFPAPGPGRRPEPAGRHQALGRIAERQRRDLGRVRVRCGRDRGKANDKRHLTRGPFHFFNKLTFLIASFSTVTFTGLTR